MTTINCRISSRMSQHISLHCTGNASYLTLMPVSASLPDSVSVDPAIDLRLELVAVRAGVGLIGSYFAAGEMNNKNSHKTNQIKACSKY